MIEKREIPTVDELDDFDLEAALAIYLKSLETKRLRKSRPWTADIIRVLWGVQYYISMDNLTRNLWEMRQPTGLNMPTSFAKTVQSALNKHTSQSKTFDGTTDDDLFYSPRGKGSGTWAVYRDRAAAWLRRKGLPPA